MACRGHVGSADLVDDRLVQAALCLQFCPDAVHLAEQNLSRIIDVANATEIHNIPLLWSGGVELAPALFHRGDRGTANAALDCQDGFRAFSFSGNSEHENLFGSVAKEHGTGQ